MGILCGHLLWALDLNNKIFGKPFWKGILEKQKRNASKT
jgi:hypothetical protein